MTLQAGNRHSQGEVRRPARSGRTKAFTLIELILVMGVLSVVFALAAPSLARFFRGRSLDSEAKRVLALTRYGQSRAVSEGVPMVLWMDQENKTYGLQAAAGYRRAMDTNAVEFTLSEQLEIEVFAPQMSAILNTWMWNRNRPQTANPVDRVETERGPVSLPAIRFLPSGFLGETSPRSIELRQGEDGQDGKLWIAQSRNGLNYEIRTNPPPDFRRY